MWRPARLVPIAIKGAYDKVTTAQTLTAHTAEQAVLYVGDILSLVQADLRRADAPKPAFASFIDVSMELLDQFKPDTVVSPLLGQGFDAIELAELLSAFGYDGEFVVIAPPVPNLGIIKADIATAAPGLRIDVRVFWQH